MKKIKMKKLLCLFVTMSMFAATGCGAKENESESGSFSSTKEHVTESETETASIEVTTETEETTKEVSFDKFKSVLNGEEAFGYDYMTDDLVEYFKEDQEYYLTDLLEHFYIEGSLPEKVSYGFFDAMKDGVPEMLVKASYAGSEDVNYIFQLREDKVFFTASYTNTEGMFDVTDAGLLVCSTKRSNGLDEVVLWHVNEKGYIDYYNAVGYFFENEAYFASLNEECYRELVSEDLKYELIIYARGDSYFVCVPEELNDEGFMDYMAFLKGEGYFSYGSFEEGNAWFDEQVASAGIADIIDDDVRVELAELNY